MTAKSVSAGRANVPVPIGGRTSGILFADTPAFMHPLGVQTGADATERVDFRLYLRAAGRIRRLRVTNRQAVGAASTVTFTVRVSGAGSGLSITLAADTAAGTVSSDDDEVTVAAGDYLTIERAYTGVTPGATDCGWTFEYVPR